MSDSTAKGLGQAAEDLTQAKRDLLHHAWTRGALPFINGGLSGMFATTCIQPIDMIKVRLQLASEGIRTGPKPTALGVTREIIAGNVLNLYTGLSAGLARQAIYTTGRMGFFDTFQDMLSARHRGSEITFVERASAGIAAGGLAAMLGNPADVALIRMQSDGLKPSAQRANYTSVLNALRRIVASEGLSTLWAGAFPTIIRAMAVNFGQLTFFAESKSQLRKYAPSMSDAPRTFSAAAIAGFFASFFSLPFDFIKTRLQKQQKGPDGKYLYNGLADCARQVIRKEGWMRVYRGFGTYYMRVSPHVMITMIAADYLKLITA